MATTATSVRAGAKQNERPGMRVDFTFSDTIAGYVSGWDAAQRRFTITTPDGRDFEAFLTPASYARYVFNLGESYQDATGDMAKLLATEGQMVFAYGTFYPAAQDSSGRFCAQWLVFPERKPGEFRHEDAGWWVEQSRSIGHSYLKWQFDWPEQEIDYANYRTFLNLAGTKKGDYLQETDTISRMIYGLSTAYMLTGEEAFLTASERGTRYLRDHMRFYDEDNDVVYWYHGIKVQGEKKQKLLTSEFGDDFYSIPMYEQIYALCGPTMTYRLTGDPAIMSDIERTMRLFKKFYRDDKQGGYFSHLDPISLDPRAESLNNNRARKNWNSVGDHAPAYLINLYLATGAAEHAAFLEETFDTIVQRFPDYAESPFVQERFHEDWSKDQSWGWQQNRSVVGHNLKIAWNLMRMHALKPKADYEAMARKIGALMPAAGSDRQRCGWYDVVERVNKPAGKDFEFVWHDRKAWWQQEQAILAYHILNGVLGDEEYLRLARESAAFYNAFFLDHDDGGVYFNTLACGLPYLLGNERLKGCHSMSAYHSMELCFLSAVYTNLLIFGRPMTFHFQPYANGFADRVLRVAPDLLPQGSVKLTAVKLDGAAYTDFDAGALAIRLPKTDRAVKVEATVTPARKK
ncbi:MAG TPA: AGE family epimerase/isomerase [Terriglobales bacterium]|nr:AGE family epimerase/isomerase [Terriglobales bacterium]